MAHFAELNKNNVVLRILVACNQDIANNGGEQSEQAAEHFKTVLPFSDNGVKWVQTSYNNNFRGHYAIVGDTYNKELNLFISKKPFPSWILNTSTGHYESPVPYPTNPPELLGYKPYSVWDEELQQWKIDPKFDIAI